MRQASSKPNSMNNHGAVLDEMGLSAVVADFQRKVIQPLARALFPGVGDELDGHHAFVVHYKRGPGGDEDLPPHRDDSEVALGNFWTGSELSFCGRMQEADVNQLKLRHQFRIGSAVLHLGRHVHAADEILAGERTNLVIWSRSWEWRAAGGDGVLGERAPSGPASSRCTRAKR